MGDDEVIHDNIYKMENPHQNTRSVQPFTETQPSWKHSNGVDNYLFIN